MACKLLEVYKTPNGTIYYLCHRKPFGEEGTMLVDLKKCEGCKSKA